MPENTTRTSCLTRGTSSTSWRTGRASWSTPERASTVRWSCSTCQWWRTRWLATTRSTTTTTTPPVPRYKCLKVTPQHNQKLVLKLNSVPSGSSLWEDINSSIQKLDPMHVDSYNIKYRAQECGQECGEAIKEEPGMYLADESQLYVQGGYQQVFDMSPHSQSQGQQHCSDLQQPFTYTIRSVQSGVSECLTSTLHSYSGTAAGAQTEYRQELEQSYSAVTEQPLARHTPPPPYSNTNYSSFSPCSSSSASLSPPIAVPSRSEISSSPVKSKYNRRNNPELEKRRTHHCDFPGCTKVYTKSSHLKAHQRIHTGKAGQWAVGTITWLSGALSHIPVTSLVIIFRLVKFLIKKWISKVFKDSLTRVILSYKAWPLSNKHWQNPRHEPTTRCW